MRKLLILSVLIFLSGCTYHPRYKTGGQETPSEINPLVKPRQTTNENLRLGVILQSYLGKPYKGQSRYDEGVDCSMFTRDVYRRFNKTILPRVSADQAKEGDPIHFNKLQYGDLVFYRTDGKKISHVGIYVSGMRFIHASSSRGVVVTNMNEKYWSKRYAGARRILK